MWVGVSSSTVSGDVRLLTTTFFLTAELYLTLHSLPHPTALTTQCEDLFSVFFALPSHYCRPVRTAPTASWKQKRSPESASPRFVAREVCQTRKQQYSCHDTRIPLPAAQASGCARHPTGRNVRCMKTARRRCLHHRHGCPRVLLPLPPPPHPPPHLPPSRRSTAAARAAVHFLSCSR